MTPLLTATPGEMPSYNVGMAETFSWVPIEGAGRPLFARTMYLANPDDIKVSLSAGDLNVGVDTTAVENLISRSNTLLNVLTADTQSIDTFASSIDAYTDAIDLSIVNTNNLLNSLTALQETKQSQIITLLHAITGISIDVDLSNDQINLNTDQVETLLNELTGTVQKIPGFSIPPYTQIAMSYYGATNNLASVTYINNSTTVLSLSFEYTTQPPTINDALLTNVKKF